MPRPVLLISNLETRFNREMFHGIITYTRRHTDWRLTHWVESQWPKPAKLPFAGILATSPNPDIRQTAHNTGIPVVLMGNAVRDPRASFVAVDEDGIGALAAAHLAELGLRHFAYVGHGDWPFVQERCASLAKAAQAMGLGPVHTLIGSFYDRRRRARFERDLSMMLRNLPRPCGLLAADDALGVVIIASCRNLGLRVPEDIAVLGVDDDEMACELSEVPLSSVAQPLFAIGFEAARLLHQRMRQPDQPPFRLLLPPVRVVARASSDLIAVEDIDVATALRLIRDHFADPINVAWIIQRLPAARRSLERRFKSLVGRTLLQQIHHVRLHKACELLAESDLPIKTIAQRSGFSNARWLADSFRRELNLSPRQYRRQFRTDG
jgi:LacI family transcriptional regulator